MKNSMLIVSLVLVIFSCKKKNEDAVVPPQQTPTTTPLPPVSSFMPLNTGNYWVYQLDVRDTNGVITATVLDSSYVYSTFILRGKTFYNIQGNNAIQGTYADSANCLIYTNGSIAFRLEHTIDTITKAFYNVGGGWYNEYIVMNLYPSTFTFNNVTYNNCAKRYVYFYSNFNALCPNRIGYNTYCPGVGMVFATCFFTNFCGAYEYSLLRYKLN